MADTTEALIMAIDANAEALRGHEAGLQAHEFLLEILYGYLWASAPEEEVERAKLKIMTLVSTAHYDGRQPGEDDVQMLEHVEQMSARFIEKAARRAAELREVTRNPA